MKKREHYQTWANNDLYQMLVEFSLTLEEFLNNQWDAGYRLVGLFEDDWIFELVKEKRKKK